MVSDVSHVFPTLTVEVRKSRSPWGLLRAATGVCDRHFSRRGAPVSYALALSGYGSLDLSIAFHFTSSIR